MRLQDWENRLRPYLSQIELLAEIPLSQAEHADLEKALGEFVQKHGLTEATRRLQRDYPAAFVAYLAFKAAFNEDRGFWDKVAQAMGLETQQSLFHPAHHWGQTFLEIIKTHQLPAFSGVSGLEYITPIRLHGGIPVYSLPDFFKHILLPSIEKAPYDGLEDAAALQALLRHSATEFFVDDVVRHFFNHSGSRGISFFVKCRQMARLARQGKPLDPAELGLRPYVVQRFETFQQEHSAPLLRRRRPRLFFDPYLPAFRIVLPPQPLTLEQAGQRYTARLYSPDDGQVHNEITRLRPTRQGQEWRLEEVSWILEEPLQNAQVGLFESGAETPFIAYAIRFLPPAGYPPLLAFDEATTREAPVSPSLPARALWLLFPADCELHFEGVARRLQSLPPFGPPWQDWQASAWDLTETRSLRLLRAGQDICPPISISRPLEPLLLPSTLPPHVLTVDEKPLYNAAPALALPLRNPQDPAEELKRWSLQLESRYAARPQGEWQASGEELPSVFENNEARLSLSYWLGETPVGTYHLKVSCPGQPETELPFRVCAGLQINGLESYYLPDEKGAHEINFQVHLPAAARLDAQDDETTITLLHPREKIKVKASPNTSQVNLLLELPIEPETVRLPLQISLPRLRWALMLERGTALEWVHQPLTRPLAELLQTDLALSRPRLRVDLPLVKTENLLAALQLTAPGHDASLQTSNSRALAAHWLDFDLADFFDTLRAHPQESVFEFALELLDANRELDLRIPMLRFTRELEIHACHFETTPTDGWRLHWLEPRPLRHRRLRLWSLWQPWADPIEIPLPDDALPSDSVSAEGWWMCDVPPEVSLPPSHYRAHFVVVSPYEHNPPPPFPPEQAIPVEMITPQSRLRHIENALQNAKPAIAFALHSEKLCIYHTQGYNAEAQEEIKWCLAHWCEASLLHLEALTRWLGKYNREEDQRAFLMYLFREENLERLEKERHSLAFIQKYLQNLRQARTLKPESARRALALARDPAVIFRALQLLLKLEAEEGRRIFWDSLTAGRFSEADAAMLLKDHPDFARHLLQEAPPSPTRARLLRELSRHLDLPEHIVKTGYFVLCDAGWGKIIEIRNAQREDIFFSGEEKPTLLIELLHWSSQKAELDLARQTLTLPGRSGVNRCICGRFAALGGEQTRVQWQEHRAFCNQTGVSPLPASFALISQPVYRTAAPANPLDTRPGE